METVEIWLGVGLLSVAVIVGMFFIIYSRLLGLSLGPWVLWVINYSVIWSVFLIAAAGVRRNTHIRILMLLDLLPKHRRNIAEVAINSFAFVTCAIVSWYGFSEIPGYIRSGSTAVELFGLPSYVLYLSVPVGLALASFHFAEKLCLLVFPPESASRGRNGGKVNE